MNSMEQRVRLKLVDNLMKEMDDHEAGQFSMRDQGHNTADRTAIVASDSGKMKQEDYDRMKQKETSRENDERIKSGDQEPRMGQPPARKEQPLPVPQPGTNTPGPYMDPNRNKVLNQIENESAMSKPQMDDDEDKVKGFGGFSRRRINS